MRLTPFKQLAPGLFACVEQFSLVDCENCIMQMQVGAESDT